MRPKFDPEEEFITLYYLQYKKSDGARHLIQDAIILIIGIGLFLLSFLKSDPTWSIIGLCFVGYLAARGLFSTSRTNRILASIIQKYDAALKSDAEPASSSEEK